VAIAIRCHGHGHPNRCAARLSVRCQGEFFETVCQNLLHSHWMVLYYP